MDRSQINLGELLFYFIAQKNCLVEIYFVLMFGEQFELNFRKSDLRSVNKCLLARTFTEDDSQGHTNFAISRI